MSAKTTDKFKPGMRVVVADGPWSVPRVGGHYGKVIEVGHPICAAYVRVQITGHIDGNPPHIPVEWFYPQELELVD